MLVKLSELNFRFSKDQIISEAGKVQAGNEGQNSQGVKFFHRKQGVTVEL